MEEKININETISALEKEWNSTGLFYEVWRMEIEVQENCVHFHCFLSEEDGDNDTDSFWIDASQDELVVLDGKEMAVKDLPKEWDKY